MEHTVSIWDSEGVGPRKVRGVLFFPFVMSFIRGSIVLFEMPMVFGSAAVLSVLYGENFHLVEN